MHVTNHRTGNRCTEAFWELVRCGLSADVPRTEPFAELDEAMWARIYRLVEVQTVIGICYEAVEKLPEPYRPPWQLLLKWHVHATYVATVNKKQRNVWFKLNRRLHEAGFHPVLLKGIGIAAYYPSPLHRMTGDLDIYLPDGFDRAVQEVKSWGIPVTYKKWHHQFLYEGVEVELHHTCWGQRKAASLQFREIKESEGTYHVPGETENALLLTEHAIHHLLEGGVGVRHLCDWAAFLSVCHSTLDAQKLYRLFRKKKIHRFVSAFSALATARLGVENPWASIRPEEFARYAALLEQDMLVHGNFGTGQPIPKPSEFRKLPKRKKGYLVWLQIARAWRFRALCPMQTYHYVGDMLSYVVRSIFSGRAFSKK